MNTKTFVLVILLLAGLTFASFRSYLPERASSVSEIQVSKFPLQVGDWQGEDIPLREEDYQILETRNLFMRQYTNSLGDSLYFYIVYSPDNRKVSHPPEICYLGSGLSVVEKGSFAVSRNITAVKLMMERPQMVQIAFYWYKAGNLYTDNYLAQQFKIVMDRLFGRKTSGALMRASTVVRDNQKDQAQKLLQKFVVEAEPLLGTYVP